MEEKNLRLSAAWKTPYSFDKTIRFQVVCKKRLLPFVKHSNWKKDSCFLSKSPINSVLLLGAFW